MEINGNSVKGFKANPLKIGVLLLSTVIIVGLISVFVSFGNKSELEEVVLCTTKECLIQRNHDLQAKNSFALSEAKETYLKAKKEYEFRQSMRETLFTEETDIINTNITGDLFQIDRNQSLNYDLVLEIEKTAK